MRSHATIRRYTFGRKNGIRISSGYDWQTERDNLSGREDIWFIDVSKTDSGTGSGYYCRKDGRITFLPLGRYVTVFQCEDYAIFRCAQRFEEFDTQDRHISIGYDSQAALKTLTTHRVTSQLVWNCKEALNRLAETRFDSSRYRDILGLEETRNRRQACRTGGQFHYRGTNALNRGC